MKSNPGNGNAIEKVLAVLDALADHNGISALASATGLPKSTVHRILRSLVDNQFAVDLGEGQYAGGPRILALAGKMMAHIAPARRVDPILRRLREDTGLTVHLGMLAGDVAVYAAKLEGAKPYQMPSRVGMSIHLHTTAIGKAVLSAMPDSEVMAFVRRAGLVARTPNTITDPEQFVAHLTQIRQRGYAVDNEENEAGIWCVAAAVFDHSGRVAGAVSVSTLVLEVGRPSAGELAPRVIGAAQEISTAFGAPTRELLVPR